jgi:hypothetical protein
MNRIVPLLGCLLVIAACRPSNESQIRRPSEFGLVEAPQNRAIVAKALRQAMQLLGTNGPNLIAGWQPADAGEAWGVYAVGPEGGGEEQIMTTYAECRCVMVRMNALSTWMRNHMGSNDALLEIDDVPLLAYMLLHEAGHIQGHSVAGSKFTAGAADEVEFNREVNADKEAEWEADQFAGMAIRRGMQQKGTAPGLTASMIAMAISQLGWNLQVHRSLDNFGATTVRDPAVFWDSGLSHPNLEWRITRVNALLTDTAEGRELLESFEEARRSGPIRLYPQ